jgi:UrcA family protein
MAKLSFFMLGLPMVIAGAAVTDTAAAEDEPRRVTVRYDDLNLSSVEGREQLAKRVRFAVRSVCPSTTARTSLIEPAYVRQCEAEAGHRAETRVAALLSGHGARFADHGTQPVITAP